MLPALIHRTAFNDFMEYQRLYPDSEDDMNSLHEVLTSAPGSFFVLEDHLPGPGDALNLLRERPPGVQQSDKYFYLIKHSGELIGCFDLIRGYPSNNVAFLGLLLIIESKQGQSYGARALNHIKRLASRLYCSHLRIVVLEKNPRALKFWIREGFVELSRKRIEKYRTDAIVKEYTLATRRI